MLVNCNCMEMSDFTLKPSKKSKGICKVLKKLKSLAKIPCSEGTGNVRSNKHQQRKHRHAIDSEVIRFHQTHGDNIELLSDGTVARRAESFCKAIAFSHRSIRINEYVYLKFAELSVNWNGAIRFGFTSCDPGTMQGSALPKYVCPDLTNKPGFWAKALPERLVEPDSVLFYYFTADGDVHFGINDQEMGVFFTGVDIREKLWAVIDVYGNTIAVEFTDSSHCRPLNNARSSCEVSSDMAAIYLNRRLGEMILAQRPSTAPMIKSTISNSNVCGGPSISRYHPQSCFSPLPFHQSHGRNIRLSNDQMSATREASEYAQGYVFTSRPLQCGERLVVQVQHEEDSYVGSLAFGLTSCDPSSLDVNQLPDDSEQLLDRKEYWVVLKNIAGGPRVGDELSFSITRQGEVQFSRNGCSPTTIMHVDQTQQLWAFFDIYGNTQKLHALGCMVDRVISRQSQPSSSSSSSPLRVKLPRSSSSHGNNLQSSMDNESAALDNADNATLNECVVCCERKADAVLYSCGHMCMCWPCARQLFERPGGDRQCPICRSVIRDVIRTYRS